MRATAFILLATGATFGSIAQGDDKKKDEFVGAIWALNVKTPKGEWVEAMKFRATVKGELMYDGKQIGTHKAKGDELTMTIDKKGPRLNGSYSLTKIKRDNSAWAGTLKRSDDGAEVPVRMKLLKD